MTKGVKLEKEFKSLSSVKRGAGSDVGKEERVKREIQQGEKEWVQEV